MTWWRGSQSPWIPPRGTWTGTAQELQAVLLDEKKSFVTLSAALQWAVLFHVAGKGTAVLGLDRGAWCVRLAYMTSEPGVPLTTASHDGAS